MDLDIHDLSISSAEETENKKTHLTNNYSLALNNLKWIDFWL